MENKLINRYSNVDNNILKYDSISVLSNNFIRHFNEIFKYNNKSINVIGNIDLPWYCGKDLMNILGYTNESTKTLLNNLDNRFKKYLYEIISVHNISTNTKLENYRKNKAIYVNEAGLYYIIIYCTKDNAKEFQDYILFDLLPSIRKYAHEKYIDILNNKQDKIDELYNQNKQIISQNQLALNKLQELGIDLKETKEEIKEVKNKLDTVIVDRNIKPKDTKRQHKYLLLKNKSNNNEFKFIRAQDQYIKTNKSIWLEKYNIIIEMDKIRINNLKNKNKYKQDKKALKDKIDNREPFIEIKGNNFILNRCDEDKFINIVKSIENEQYNI
ncbi:N1R/p28-like protein [Choristoneura rosaceana entomopoxvirus 'L']|uniref:N1R/p28-like protein n=1 Tax=Choristoneura rosaceana entomopoxvirus 'L' TaxID=1293539 RepID=A0ABM9QKA6_9POXV|nr:N1R/p28-like protein [Choristoneura rosaceana entomopoxvirus 'L']CCU55977.1 N1R/p28-like protein [Choristoneura rosaceana entomopoxvirus 'L']